MGIPDRLTYLPRNLYVNQKATVRALCGTTDWCRIEKGVQQGCLLSPYLLNLYTEHIMRNARLYELQAGIKIGRRIINNLRYADDTTLMTESEEELKCLLMRAKEETERASLKLNIKKKNLRPRHQSHHFTTNRRGRGGSSDRAPFLGLRITEDGDGSHGIR